MNEKGFGSLIQGISANKPSGQSEMGWPLHKTASYEDGDIAAVHSIDLTITISVHHPNKRKEDYAVPSTSDLFCDLGGTQKPEQKTAPMHPTNLLFCATWVIVSMTKKGYYPPHFEMVVRIVGDIFCQVVACLV